MRCACVDIGSNTIRVLVADVASGRLTPVLQERAFTRIGRSLRLSGCVPPAKVQEVCAVVEGQLARAREAQAQAVRVVATAALRDAHNGPALCAALHARAGVEVDVLGAEEEARLAFLGATRTLAPGSAPVPEGPVGVVDVGGGSSELVVGTVAGGVAWSCSVPIGSGALTDAHDPSDPLTPAELDAMRAQAAAAFAGHSPPPSDRAVAVGGSATSLRRLAGAQLTPASLDRAIAVLRAAPCQAVAARLDLDPERVRLLPAGILLLQAAAERLGRPLQVGHGGLREGVCLDLAH